MSSPTTLNPLLSVELPLRPLLSTEMSSGSFLRRKDRRMIMTTIMQRMMKPTMPTMSRISLQQLLLSEVNLPQALSFMLRLCQSGLGCPVEIEFALKLRKSPEAKHELQILQVRPQQEITASAAARALRFKYLPGEQYSAVASTHALGHGSFEGISDIVYVDPQDYDAVDSEILAREIGELNTRLREEGRRYLLMAPGRWGNADGTKGIPVKWYDIDGAGFIVESTIPGKGTEVPLSQGSHFFQNIMSFGIGYATIDTTGASDEEGAVEVADYAYLNSLPRQQHGGKIVRHVQLEAPLEIVVDGVSRRGVVMKPGSPFDLYVGQVDAFMALQESQFGSMG